MKAEFYYSGGTRYQQSDLLDPQAFPVLSLLCKFDDLPLMPTGARVEFDGKIYRISTSLIILSIRVVRYVLRYADSNVI